jgi:SpoVK/Ycf46/Vps4 family AAA+-type ATPase
MSAADPTGGVVETVLQFNMMSSMKTGNPIVDMLLSAMLLSLLGYVFSSLSEQKAVLAAWIRKKLMRKPKSELTFQGEEFHDNWGDVHRRFPDTFRAILHHIDTTKCKGVNAYEEIQTKSNRRWNDKKDKVKEPVTYMPNVDDQFELIPGILCESRVEEEVEQNGKKESSSRKTRTLKIRVFSHTKTIEELKSFIADLLRAFMKFMKEEVDQTQNYFITKIDKIDDTPTLLYDQFEFVSTRSFDNIFFEQKDELIRRLDFFLNNQDWYKKRGVPYTLGFMFYGPPGTGKTSTIKAIATYTKRHLVEVSLSRIKTYKDLQRVFNETTFCDKTIPHHKMIYILEDIDCLDNIVKARDLTSDDRDEEKKKDKDKDGSEDEGEDPIAKGLDAAMKLEYEYFKSQMKSWNKDPLTLSHILNIIDGLLECHGRILIITTNQPEKLDSALIRPGRVDMKIHFDWCTTDDTIKIVEMFYEKPVPEDVKSMIVNKKFTAAEVYQICFQSLDIKRALAQLTKRETESLSDSAKSLSQSRSNLSSSQNSLTQSKRKRQYLHEGASVTLQFNNRF